MILTQSQINILTNGEPYNCSLVKQKWSYTILKDQISPLGNILAFESPVNIGSLYLKKGLLFAIELPNVNMFGGVSFLRLYLTQLGSLLSQMTNKDYFVNESTIFIDQSQCSVSLTNHIKESALFNIIFSFENHESLQHLTLSSEESISFQQKAIDCFHHLVKSIFIETKRDNI